jgi:hypothetical protein
LKLGVSCKSLIDKRREILAFLKNPCVGGSIPPLATRFRGLTGLIIAAAAVLSVAPGCTWQQPYFAGQRWQRNQMQRGSSSKPSVTAA